MAYLTQTSKVPSRRVASQTRGSTARHILDDSELMSKDGAMVVARLLLIEANDIPKASDKTGSNYDPGIASELCSDYIDIYLIWRVAVDELHVIHL